MPYRLRYASQCRFYPCRGLGSRGERWKDVFFLSIGSFYHDTIMGLLDQLIELRLPPHIIPSIIISHTVNYGIYNTKVLSQ